MQLSCALHRGWLLKTSCASAACCPQGLLLCHLRTDGIAGDHAIMISSDRAVWMGPAVRAAMAVADPRGFCLCTVCVEYKTWIGAPSLQPVVWHTLEPPHVATASATSAHTRCKQTRPHPLALQQCCRRQLRHCTQPLRTKQQISIQPAAAMTSGRHGASSVEVYGFVGWIASFVAAGGCAETRLAW